MAKQLKVDLTVNANTERAKAQIQDLQKTLSQVGAKAGSSAKLFDATSMKEASNAARELQRHLQSAVDVNTGRLNLSTFSASLKASGKSLSDYRLALERMGPEGEAAFLKVSESIATADAPLMKTNAKLKEFATTLKNTARWQISSSILHGFIGSVQKAYGYAQDLNESLNNIRIVTGQTAEQMDKFAAKANRAAKELSTTTTAYTDAALIFYQQGLNDEQVAERTEATIKMAHAAGESATEVSSYMTAIWNNFADGSKSLEYYGDVMTALGATTAASSAEIAEGLEKFASIGETVGLSYEYASAAIATVVDKTRQSADTVGTAFKTIFSRLQGLQLGETLEDGTDLNKYSSALMAVGINIKDANGELKDMDVILDEMGAKWQTLHRDEQMALAQTVAGVRQYTQLMSLMNNYEDFKINVDAAETSEGTLQEQADIYAESWEAAEARVKAAAENIYAALLDDDFFIDLTNGFATLLEGLGGFIDGFGGMQSILMTIGAFISQSLAKEAPAALNRIKESLLQVSGLAHDAANTMQQQNMADLQKKADSEMYSVQYEDQGSMEYAAKAQMTAYIAEQKNKLIQYENEYSNAEKMAAEAEIDHLQTQSGLLQEKGKRYDELKGEVQDLELTLSKMGQNAAGKDGKSSGIDTELTSLKTLIGKNSPVLKLKQEFAQLSKSSTDASKIVGKDAESLRKQLLSLTKVAGSRAETQDMKDRWAAVGKQLKEAGKDGQLTGEQLRGIIEKSGLIQEADKAEQEIKQLRDELAKTDGVNPAVLDAFIARLKEMGIIGADVPAQLENIKNGMMNMKPHVSTASEAVMSFSGALMQANAFINSMKSLRDVFTNEDSTAVEKVGAVIGGLTSAIMMFSAASKFAQTMMQLENAGILKNAILKLFGKTATDASTVSKGTETGATIGQALANIFLESTMLPVLVITLALIAAMLILTGVITLIVSGIQALSDMYNKDAIAAEEAAESAKNLKEAAEEAKDALDEITADVDNYESLIEKLEGCTKGTERWNEALREVNDAASELLQKYPELLKQKDLYNEDGTFNLDALDRVVEQYEQNATNAEAAALMGNARAMKAQAVANETEFVRSDNQAGNYALQGAVHGTGAAVMTAFMAAAAGAAIGSAVPLIGTAIGAVVGLVGGLIVDAVDNANERDNIDTISKNYELHGEQALTDAAIAKELGINLDKATESQLKYIESIRALVRETDAAAVAFDNAAKTAVETWAESNGMKLDPAEKEMLGEKYEDIYQSIYDEVIDTDAKKNSKASNKDNSGVWERYLKATGQDLDLARNGIRGTDGNRTYAYLEDGEEKEIRIEEIAETIAAAEALEQMGVAAREVSEALNNLANNLPEGVASGLRGWITNGNFDNMTAQDFNTMQTDINDNYGGSISAYLQDKLGMTEEQLIAIFGTNFVEAFQADMDQFSQDFEEAGKNLLPDAKKMFDSTFNENRNITVGTKKKMGQNYEALYADGGQAYVDTLDTFLNKFEGEAFDTVAGIMADIDWSSLDAGDEFRERLKAEGIEYSEELVDGVVTVMNDAYDALPNMKELMETLTKVGELAKDISLGQILSQEDYETLVGYNKELQKYFTILADGSAQFIGDPLDFQQEVAASQRESLIQAGQMFLAQSKEAEAILNAGLQAIGGKDVDDILQWTDTENYTVKNEDGTTSNYYNGRNVNKQIEFLKSQGYGDTAEGAQQLAEWEADLANGDTTVGVLEDIAEAVNETSESFRNAGNEAVTFQAQYQACMNSLALLAEDADERLAMLESGQINQQAYDSAVNAAINAEAWEDLDVEAVGQYAEYLEDAFGIAEEGSEEVARAVTKMNKGVQDLSDNWEDWGDILKTGNKQGHEASKMSQEYAEAMQGTRKALSDILDVSEDFISVDFVSSAENLELIGKAAEGDAEAIDALAVKLATDIAMQSLHLNLGDVLKIDGAEYAGEQAIAKINEMMSNIQAAMDNANLTVGQNIDSGPVLEELNRVVQASAMTAEQANAFYRSMGFTPHFKMVDAVQAESVPITTTHHQRTVHEYDEHGNPISWTDNEYTETQQVPGGELHSALPAMTMETADGQMAQVPSTEIESVTYTGGGSLNNFSNTNSGGQKPSGSSSSDSDKEYNDEDYKDATEEKERYKVIENQLESLANVLDNVSKAKDKAFGRARLDALNKEIEAQKKYTQAAKDYLDEVEDYYSDDRAAVEALGAQFDNENNIINRDAIIEAAVADYNAAVDAFNAATTDDEGAKKAFEAAQERYDKILEALDQYDDTLHRREEAAQDYLDQLMTEQSQLLERTQLEVELKMDVSEDALNYLEYMLDNIENKAYDCAEAFSYLNGMTQEYFNQAEALEGGLRALFENEGLTDDDFNKLVAGDNATYEKLMGMLSSGGSADLTDGLSQEEIDAVQGFTADDVDTMRDYVSQLIETNQNLQEIRQTVHEQILNVWDEWNEKLDTGISKLEHLQAITESYNNIIDIVGQKNLGVSNAFMSKMQQQSVDQANDKLQAEKARYDELKKARDNAYAKFQEQKDKGILSPEEIQQWEDSLAQMDEDVQSAAESFQTSWEDALTAANEAFEAAVDRIIQAYDDAAAGLMGSMSELQEAFDRKSDLSSQYLDDYEKIYQLSKLNRELENSIDSTSNTKAKAELLELQSKINAYEEAGVEISEYQMEQLRQEYELKKAQIELEEAQDAKSQVQMTRDADGNYSYVYTASTEDVAKAEQNYEDKLHAMQESNINYINDLESNMIQLEQECQEKIQEILKDTSLTAEERMIKLNEVTAYHDEKMKFYISEAQLWEENSQRLYEEDWMNYAAATGYKIAEEDKWLDHWNETQLAQLTGFMTLEEYQSNHNTNVANLLLASGEAFATWQTNIETAMQNAGTSMGTFQEDAQEVLDTVAEESEETKDSVVDMADSAADAIGDVVDAVVDWENQYSQTVQKMLTWNNALITSFNQLIAGWSAVQSSANSSGAGSGDGDNGGDNGNNGDTGGNSGDGGNGGGNVDNSDKVAGVAAAIWMDGGSASGWGNDPTRAKRLKEKGVEGAQAYINAHGPNGDIYADWSSKRNKLRSYYYGSFDTGGYTGEWGDTQGRLAMLHQKEIVLNEDDTSNFLKTIDMVRQIAEMIDLNALSSAGGFNSLFAATSSNLATTLQQEVTIHAEFPNATDKDEISAAFSDLVNLASQYAHRK